MKQRAALCLFVVILSGLLCGCNLWSKGEYSSVTPHVEQNAQPEQEILEAHSYYELRIALTDLVENVSQEGIISVSSIEPEKVEEYMQMAIESVMQTNAIGAYAVEMIEYEIGTSAGKAAIAVDIVYSHSRAEVMRIEEAQTQEQMESLITNALDNCDAGVVMKVTHFVETDFAQLVQDYADTHPEICMEVPQVTAVTYPDSGRERVVELLFTYQNSREVLRSMKLTVQIILSRLSINLGSGESVYSQLFTFLLDLHEEYSIETSITSAYSLLHHGVGDSKAFAYVFGALCRRASVDCQVISGTKDGEPRFWNVIEQDGVYFHVDLLQCYQSGEFQILNGSQMKGYVWDYTAYPIEEKQDKPEDPSDLDTDTTDPTEATQPTAVDTTDQTEDTQAAEAGIADPTENDHPLTESTTVPTEQTRPYSEEPVQAPEPIQPATTLPEQTPEDQNETIPLQG